MSATELYSMIPGDTGNVSGVSFTFQPSLPDLAQSTSSQPEGFYWKWLLFGRIFESLDGNITNYDGALIVGTHRTALHALGLPEQGSGFRYQAASSDIFDASVRMGKGMFKKGKLEAVRLIVSPVFGIAASRIDELSQQGQPVRTSQEQAFCAEFGVAIPG